ncbi:MAG: DUF6427 family protein [Bacteroidales bacterium]
MFEKLFTEKRIPHLLVIVLLLTVIIISVSLFADTSSFSLSLPNECSSFLSSWLYDIFGTHILVKATKLVALTIPTLVIISQISKHTKLFNEVYPMSSWACLCLILPTYLIVGLSPVIPALMLVAMSTKALFNFNANRNGAFDSGFYLALASIVFLPAILLFVVQLIGALIIRSKKPLSSLILFIIGFTLPALIIASSVYIFDVNNTFDFKTIALNYISFESAHSMTSYIYAGIMVLISLLSAFSFNTLLSEKTVLDKRVNTYYLVFTISLIISSLIFHDLLIYFLILYFIPFSYFLPILYLSLKKKKPILRIILLDTFVLSSITLSILLLLGYTS